jgi:hypothetical protein
MVIRGWLFVVGCSLFVAGSFGEELQGVRGGNEYWKMDNEDCKIAVRRSILQFAIPITHLLFRGEGLC